ncbi:MAG TPA: TolC family protein [Chlamydiales bacterium]|nr:TolC family protein [Chlamydiales bacterium]
MRFYKKKLFFIFLIMLFGCSKYNGASDPLIYTPLTANSYWINNKSKKADETSCGLQSEKKDPCLQEYSLAELIDTALTNNPDTQSSWAQAQTAAALYGQSLSPYYPTIDFNASLYRRRATISTFNSYGVTQNGNTLPYYYETRGGPEIDLSYTLLDFGKRKSSSDEALQSLHYANWMHNREIQSVMQIVMDDYYNYLYEIEAVTASSQDLITAQKSLDAANTRYEAGVASIADVMQAKTTYLQTKIQYNNQKQQKIDAYATLLKDIGLPSNKILSINPLPEEIETKDIIASLDDLISLSMHYRQDLLATVANVKAKEASFEYAKALERPDFGAHLNVGKFYYDDMKTEDYHYNAQVNLTFPIFKGFFYKNGIRKAKADFEKAQAALKQLELSIVQDITISKSTVETSASNLQDSKDYYESAKTQYEISLSQYRAGVSTILDLLSSQSALADARAKKALAKRDWFQSLSTLAYATGSLCLKENYETRSIK